MNPQGGIPCRAEGSALTRGMAVVVGTARDQVKLGSGANLPVIGFMVNDVLEGGEGAYFPVNGAGKCKGIAGASFDRGDILVLEGADGRLAKLTPSGTTQYGCAIADEDGADGQLVDIFPSFFVVDTGA